MFFKTQAWIQDFGVGVKEAGRGLLKLETLYDEKTLGMPNETEQEEEEVVEENIEDKTGIVTRLEITAENRNGTNE